MKLYQNKHLERAAQFNHKKVEKNSTNTLLEKHAKVKPRTVFGRKQSKNPEKITSKSLVLQKNLIRTRYKYKSPKIRSKNNRKIKKENCFGPCIGFLWLQ